MNFAYGDWIVLSDRLTNWGSRDSEKQHRFIVVAERLGQVVVLGRSTDRENYEGLAHSAHNGLCYESTCKIDVEGRISTDPIRPIDLRHVGDGWSCREPSDVVLDWVWDHAPKRLK